MTPPPPPRRPSRPPAAAVAAAAASRTRRHSVRMQQQQQQQPSVHTAAAAAAAAGGDVAVTSSLPSPPPRYWQAVCDAALYAGPLGEVVGVAAAGTVLVERCCFSDPFGGVWLAAAAAHQHQHDDKGEDDELVWVCHTRGCNEAVASSWRRVRSAQDGEDDDDDNESEDSKRTAPIATTATSSDACDSCHCCGEGDDDDDAELLCDAALFDYYWTSSATAALRTRARQQHAQQQTAAAHHSDTTTHAAASPWNARYQAAVEALLLSSPHDNVEHNNSSSSSSEDDTSDDAHAARLQCCLDAFADAAQAAVVALLEDMQRNVAERRCVSHTTRPDVFYTHDALLLRVVVDAADGRYGGDAAAHAAASRALRSYRVLAHVAPRWLLCLPLMALVTFAGQCVVVTAVPPLLRRDCVYDKCSRHDSSTSTTSTPHDALVQQLLDGVGAALNLRPHTVTCTKAASTTAAATTRTRTWRTTLPCDVQVYAGRDRRLYLLRAGRVLPPLLPRHASMHARQQQQPQWRRSVRAACDEAVVRAELLLRWPVPLNADVGLHGRCRCCSGCCNADVDDNNNNNDESDDGGDDSVRVACAVARCVHEEVVTHVAGILGMHLPVRLAADVSDASTHATTSVAAHSPVQSCTLCGRPLGDDELRLVACMRTERCCAVCTHCYTRRVHETIAAVATSAHTHDDNTTASSAAAAAAMLAMTHFDDAVRCGAAVRPGNALLLVPDVTTLMHACGLCMRFVPFVYHRLPRVSAPLMRHYCEVEMVARAAARVLRRRLRRDPPATAHDLQQTIEHVLRCLLLVRAEHTRAASPDNDNNDNNGNNNDESSDCVVAAAGRDGGGEAMADALQFWCDELGPELQCHFAGIVQPFVTRWLSPLLLAERVSRLTGVTLDAASVTSLCRATTTTTTTTTTAVRDNSDDDAFVRVVQVQPCVKTYALPRRRPRTCRDTDGSKAGECCDDALCACADIARLRRVLERVLLFWIAHTHDGAGDVDEAGATTTQPFYLLDSFVRAV